MLKYLKFGVVGAIGAFILAVFLTPFAVKSEEGITPSSVVLLEDFGIDNIGLLPTNPFYFIKELGRGVKRALALGSVQKAELELKILNEKGAELKKIEQLTPKNTAAILTALENYLSGVRMADQQLAEISAGDINKVAGQLIFVSLLHQMMLDDLSGSELDGKPLLFEAQDELSRLFARGAPQDDSEILRLNIQRISDKTRSSLRLAEAMTRLEKYLNTPQLKTLLQAKEDVLMKIGGQLESGKSLNIANWYGDPALRVAVLDEIRERVRSAEVKTNLNILRQEILERLKMKPGITNNDAQEEINNAIKLIQNLEKEISKREGGVSLAVQELWERAEFNKNQAEALFDKGNFAGAFSQAVSSSAAAKDALLQLSYDSKDVLLELSALKTRLDKLSALARETGLLQESNSDFTRFFNEAERRTAQISDMVSAETEISRIVPLLRTTKLILGIMDAMVK